MMTKNQVLNKKKEKIKRLQTMNKQPWLIFKLGKICKTTSGGTPLKNKKEYYKDGTIPWIKSGEVAKGLIYSSQEKITESGLKNSSAKKFPKNTVLIAMYGATAGKVGLLKIEATTNQAICGILPNKKFIPEFLYMYLKNQTSNIARLSSGGAQMNISQTIIKNLKIPLPPLDEQRKIAAVLSQIQQNIEIKDQLIETTKELKKSVMQHLFTYGTKKEPTKHNWSITQLGDISEIVPGQSPKGKYYNTNGKGMPFYQGKTEFGDKYIFQPKKWTTQITKIAQKNDIVMSIRAPVGPVNITLFKICIGRGLAVIRGNSSKINQEYLFYLLQEKQKKISGNKGSIFASINKNDIQKIKIPLPSMDEQVKIAGVLQKIDEKIKNYEEQKSSLQDLFKSMLHKLMTGQIRLHNLPLLIPKKPFKKDQMKKYKTNSDLLKSIINSGIEKRR